MGKGYSPEQIIRKLRQAEGEFATGSTIPEVSRELGISEATFHRWKKQYGGMSQQEAKRLKELEKENARLKKMVAEQALDIDILKEVNRGNFNHVWSYDFAMDATEDGRRLKVMPVVDEYTRECLSLEGQRSIKADGVVDTLRRLFTERGEPTYIRSDNGPEFIAQEIKECLAISGVKTLYIEPGAPWENAYSETFISRLRDELLERELFANLKEAQVLLEDYRDHYNQIRPHGALGYLSPAEFAAIEALTGRSPGPPEQLEFVQRLSS